MLDSLQYEKTTRPKLVHRLDRDTSGVLLVARTAQAASGLSPVAGAARRLQNLLGAGQAACRNRSTAWSRRRWPRKAARGRDERMAHDDEDDEGAKFALTEYAVMGTAGRNSPGSRRGPSPAAPTRSACIWPAWARPSSAISNMAARSRAGKGDDRRQAASACPLASISRRPDGGRLQVTAPLPPHMVKSWKLLGFDPDDRRDPFPAEETRRKDEALLQGRVGGAGGRRLSPSCWTAGRCKTPGRNTLVLPTETLAAAIAAEWRGAGRGDHRRLHAAAAPGQHA